MTNRYKNGLDMRKTVMGDEFVAAALGKATEFSEPLQTLVTENAWGSVWTRDGLDKKTRSLITLSMLVALKAPNELQGHVRGALRNGCSIEEIREVLLHAAAYCGFPAVIEAFRAAQPVIDQWQDEQA